MPDDLPADEAAPLLCAGITVFNSLRNSGARAAATPLPSRELAASDISASSMPARWVFARSRSARGGDKEVLAKKLGAHSTSTRTRVIPRKSLQKLGGADIVLATAPDSKSMSALVNGWPRHDGTLSWSEPGLILSNVTPFNSSWGARPCADGLGHRAQRFRGHAAVQFVVSGVRPMIERYPLEKAADAYQQMISGKARFRVVLT